jgi:putative oxidoreductase
MSTIASGSRTDLGLFLIRLMPGLVFVFHGSQKLFGAFGGGGLSGTASSFAGLGIPLPWVGALLSGLVELLGGLALLTGVGLRPLATLLAANMLVASFAAHSGFSAQQGGMEYPLTLAFVAAGLALTGPGRYGVQIGAKQH